MPPSRNPGCRLSTPTIDELPLRNEHDIVLARQHVRRLTQQLGFGLVDQTKMVTAARLMGAECIISGIRPQIAQTIVHLGVDLEGVTTKATLADAFSIALQRLGIGFHRATTARS